ncbi:MAG TPA: hypothetical protein VNI57_09895, partial [Candidatus Saccharimonadales bacterium]|nr:hypothetical protein [Candidatus Saccharimonadales bacterium]
MFRLLFTATSTCLALISIALAGAAPPSSASPSSTDPSSTVAGSPSKPASPPESGPGPEQAGSAAERLLREAGADAEADLAALKKFEAGLTGRIDSTEAESAEATGRITEMTASLRSLGAGGGSADLLYDRIVGQIVDARAGLRNALSALGEASDVPPRPEAPTLAGMDDPALTGEITRIEGLRGEAQDLRDRLRGMEAQARWHQVELAWKRVEALQALRLECFDDLSSLKRSELLGLTREGMAQLGREWRQLDLTARYRFERAVREIRGLPSRLTDLYFVGALGWALLKTLVVVLIVVWVRRRVPPVVAQLRESAARWGIGETRSNRRRGLARLIEVIVPWGVLLPGIHAVRWALGSWSLVHEIDIALKLAELYAVYRLAIDLLRAASVAVARRYRLRLDDERRTKIAGSVITFLRLAVGIVLITTLAAALVGQGT